MNPEVCIEKFIGAANRNPNNDIGGLPRRRILTPDFHDDGRFRDDLFIGVFEHNQVAFWGDRSLIDSAPSSLTNSKGEAYGSDAEEIDTVRRGNRLVAVLQLQPGSNAAIYHRSDISLEAALTKARRVLPQGILVH